GLGGGGVASTGGGLGEVVEGGQGVGQATEDEGLGEDGAAELALALAKAAVFCRGVGAVEQDGLQGGGHFGNLGHGKVLLAFRACWLQVTKWTGLPVFNPPPHPSLYPYEGRNPFPRLRFGLQPERPRSVLFPGRPAVASGLLHQPVLLHLLVQRDAADPQRQRRPRAVVAVVRQRPQDQRPLGRVAVGGERSGVAALRRRTRRRDVLADLLRQVLVQQLRAGRDQHRLLHGVLQLADVARPREALQRVERARGDVEQLLLEARVETRR